MDLLPFSTSHQENLVQMLVSVYTSQIEKGMHQSCLSLIFCVTLTENNLCRQGALTRPVTGTTVLLPEPSSPGPPSLLYTVGPGEYDHSLPSLTMMGL